MFLDSIQKHTDFDQKKKYFVEAYICYQSTILERNIPNSYVRPYFTNATESFSLRFIQLRRSQANVIDL